MPTITIIMATYNRAHFIVETLQSIQSQTFTDWECLIIDDGGTDKTFEIITPILEKDRRFQFLRRPETYVKGLPGCRNYGLDLAQGDFIIFFDDDDIPHPQNLELCVKELSSNNVSFCRYIRNVFFENFHSEFDYSKSYSSFTIDKSDIEKIIKNELPFNSCAVMWKKDCFETARFVEYLMYAEEWELYSRIVSCGFKGISIDKCLFFGRKHTNSNTGEFFNNYPIRRESYAKAILLVVQNLKEKQLLSTRLKRHFVTLSIDYPEYNLFGDLLNDWNLSTFEKIKWQFFYHSYFVRLPIYKIKKAFQK